MCSHDDIRCERLGHVWVNREYWRNGQILKKVLNRFDRFLAHNLANKAQQQAVIIADNKYLGSAVVVSALILICLGYSHPI